MSFCSNFLFVSLLASSSCASLASNRLHQQCRAESLVLTADLKCSIDGLDDFNVDDHPGFHLDDWRTGSQRQQETKPDSHPWTHAPICTDVLKSLGDKLCVYTNATFSKGRGISIFTTPKIAESFHSLPALQDAESLEDINVFSGSWYTEELPGKGVGMLAQKQLNFKDRITAYTPAFLALLEDELSTLEREKYFRKAISQLPETTRNMFMNLTTVYGDPRVQAQDIVKANTFQLQIDGQNHLAIFPETSRLNHACSPNAQYYLDPGLLTHFVHATRPIAPGEELTISCMRAPSSEPSRSKSGVDTSPLELTDVRQQHLQSGFHFTCACSRCTAKSTSDNLLSEIRTLQSALNDWSFTSSGSPKTAIKLLGLYRKEGLEGFLDVPYGFAALAYNAVGESKEAQKYANLAKEIILLKDGPWAPNLKVWEELLQSPKDHWSHRRRL